MTGALSKEVISDEGELCIGHIHICDQQNRSYKRGGPSQGWSLKRGTTVHHEFIENLCNSKILRI